MLGMHVAGNVTAVQHKARVQPAQVDRIQAALRASQRDVPPSPTRKLNRAINEENERFIGSELDNQQQVVRWAGVALTASIWPLLRQSALEALLCTEQTTRSIGSSL
jgi:hypothetical protein